MALGGHLAEMLLQLGDRGPDSAGLAIYRDRVPSGSTKVTLHSADRRQDWDRVQSALDAVQRGQRDRRVEHRRPQPLPRRARRRRLRSLQPTEQP